MSKLINFDVLQLALEAWENQTLGHWFIMYLLMELSFPTPRMGCGSKHGRYYQVLINVFVSCSCVWKMGLLTLEFTLDKSGFFFYLFQGGSGYASDMKFMNIWMENVAYPIIIDQYYCDSDLPCANQVSVLYNA